MKTNNSTGLPSSVMGMGRKEKKKVITVLIAIALSLLSIYSLQFNKHRNTVAPSYATGNETVEEKRKDYLETLIDNKIEELKKDGYNNITYQKTIEDLDNSLNISKIELNEESIAEHMLRNYEFYAEYKKVTVNKKDYLFKSSKEANAFIKKLKKYENKTYKINNIKKQIGKETLKDTIDEIILKKKIAAEKAVAEQKARLKAQKAAAASKIKKETKSSKNTTVTAVNKTSSKTTIDNTNNSNLGQKIANYAKQFVGNPYVHGGTSLTKGADCSGFTQSVYKHFGISIPRVARAQAKVGKSVSWNNLQPGDLVFYSGNGGRSVTHVAIYIGNGKIVHAQTPRLGIGITTAKIMIWMGARRII